MFGWLRRKRRPPEVLPGSEWWGVRILTGYRFRVLDLNPPEWPGTIAVICWGPAWPLDGGRTFLPPEAFGDVVVAR